MPFVENEAVKIHYQVEGKGPPVILIRGFPGSLEFWYKFNYVESLKQKFQLILIDKRGHGKSSKPHNPDDYRQEKFASDVIAVLDDLQLEKAHFWGYSFGAYIGFILAECYPERFHSFIFGGASPQDLSEEQLEAANRFFESMRGGLEGYLAFFENQGIEIPPEHRKEIEGWD
jgi:pimeloyl-ACP methyl ester carboxylesterase